MAKAEIIGTGLNGLIGSKFAKHFENKYHCVNFDISHPTEPTDITDFNQVLEKMQHSVAQYVLHFAAYTDVTKAWEQRDQKNGPAYQINVVGTENIAKAAAQTGKHLIHISTAYIFSGQKEAPYTESDKPEPIEWYGQTKAWAEEMVQKHAKKWTILRIDQPFRSDSFPRLDVAHRIITGLRSNTLYPQFTDHFFGPTFIDDFVKVIDWVIRTGIGQIFHASSGEQWSDFDFATAIKETLHLSGQISPGALATYLQTLNRPYQRNTALDCAKLKAALDFQLTPIKTALRSIQL